MDKIGKFEVIEKIGEGGFGTIFKGRDPLIKRYVAIKTCTSEDQSIRDRFFREAEIAGNLQHRHIVTVYDFGIHDGAPYLVQEYLSGEDLDRKVKRKDFLPFAEKLLYLLQIARGLENAHEQGVIHRDIKPANIRILEDGTAKIMDFGIAKLAHQETGLTQTGMTLGTAAYLAPEQIRGEAVDPRTDIFSYGVLAYELLSFERPFQGKHLSHVLYQILNAEPQPLGALVNDCPAALDRLVMRCLAKDPDQRYAKFGEVLADLDGILRSRRGQDASPAFAVTQLESEQAAERTRRLATADIPKPPPGSAAPPPPAPPRAKMEDLDLSLGDDTRTPHSISTTAALRHRGFAWGKWVAVVVLLAVVGAAGWLFLRQRARGENVAATDPLTTTVGEETSIAPGPAGGVGAGAVAEPATPGVEGEGAGTPEGDEPPAAEEELAEAQEAEPEPEPPPPPPPGVLVLPAAGSSDISAVVAGETFRLGTSHRVELEAGRHTLTFRVRHQGYEASERVTIDLAAGQQREVRSPVRLPGTLTVQALPLKPPGLVFVDDRQVGVGRASLTVGAGSHSLRIAPERSGEPLLVEVEVGPGETVVVSYDLKAGESVVRRTGG